jgi:hypothetical protein
VYLFLACFWLVVGVLVQMYWTTLQPRMLIPVDRGVMGFIFFVMFSYCFIRWRLARIRQQAIEEANEPPPRPRHAEEPIDPAFDFSDKKSDDEKKKE